LWPLDRQRIKHKKKGTKKVYTGKKDTININIGKKKQNLKKRRD
jgi:hypothetical protein